jgi:hypothetical protein
MSESIPAQHFKWAEKATQRKEEFSQLLDDPAFKDIFNEKFIDGLEKRRENLDAQFRRVQVIQLSSLVILGLILVAPRINVSFFGLISSDGRWLREILMFLSATVQLYTGLLLNPRQVYISEILQVYALKLSKGNPGALRVLYLRYGTGETEMLKLPKQKYTAGQIFGIISAAIGTLTWVFISALCVFLVEVAAAVSVIADPTFSRRISVSLVIYVLLVFVAGMSIQAMAGVRPKS